MRTTGWQEYCELSDLALQPLLTKMDTGARTSVLHATEIVCREGRTYFMGPGNINCSAKLQGYRTITTSIGTIEQRPVIITEVKLDRYRWTIELTLRDRSGLECPLLLGRQALENNYLVNSAAQFLLTSPVSARCDFG